MKKLLFILFVFATSFSFSQTSEFVEIMKNTRQSYEDRGYVFMSQTSDSISTSVPLVTQDIQLVAKSTYLVVIQLDGCMYCEYELYFVDENNNMTPVEYEENIIGNLKESTVRFKNETLTNGKYIILLKSDLPYFANMYIFTK